MVMDGDGRDFRQTASRCCASLKFSVDVDDVFVTIQWVLFLFLVSRPFRKKRRESMHLYHFLCYGLGVHTLKMDIT